MWGAKSTALLPLSSEILVRQCRWAFLVSKKLSTEIVTFIFPGWVSSITTLLVGQVSTPGRRQIKVLAFSKWLRASRNLKSWFRRKKVLNMWHEFSFPTTKAMEISSLLVRKSTFNKSMHRNIQRNLCIFLKKGIIPVCIEVI